jgi:hypothetical protein
LPFVWIRTIDFKPRCVQTLARFDVQHELCIDELLAAVVQQN